MATETKPKKKAPKKPKEIPALDDLMNELESLGTAQARKIYARHGAHENMFGVSFKHQNELHKRIGTAHELALQLWETGNLDAMILATFIADPDQMSATDCEKWVKEGGGYMVNDQVAKLVAQSAHAEKKIKKWTASKKELVKRCGYTVLNITATASNELPDEYFLEYLDRIEEEIHESPNRAREGMNNCMIGIGMRNKALHKAATATAKRVGEVFVDHGETGCKTNDVAVYLQNPRILKKLK